jgi:hypothetical protein
MNLDRQQSVSQLIIGSFLRRSLSYLFLTLIFRGGLVIRLNGNRDILSFVIFMKRAAVGKKGIQ